MHGSESVEKTLEEYNDVFADIVNVLLFHGQRIIKEDELDDALPRSHYKADSTIHELERDTAKFWKNGQIRISLIGLENQTRTDDDMPLRIIAYDGIAYRKQLLHSSKQRFPVVTLVLYFGEKPWTTHTKLSEYFEIPEILRPYVNDYRINVFDISALTEEQVAQFQSDFRIVADFFVQKQKNKGYAPSAQKIQHVNEILEFMAVMTADQRFEEAQKTVWKEETNMCNIIDQYIDLGIEKGIEQGMTKGIEAIVEFCREDGKSRDTATEKIMEKFSLPLDKAKEYVNRFWN